MGILYWKVLEEPTMIRIAIVVCCAALAAAEAEADPALFYSSYGHQGLYQPGYSTYRFPTSMRSYTAPLTSSYSAHYGFPAYQAGFAAPATVGAHQPYGYAASGRYLANSVGAVHIAKREAEAEPEAEPEAEAEAEAEADPALFYNSFGYHNTGYNMAYTAPYTTPYNMAYSTPYTTPYTAPYNAYRYPAVYSRNHYQPSYNNGGYRSFYGKREAEAEAEAEPAVYGHHQALYNPAFNTYTTGFPALRSYAAPVSSYPGYNLGSFYSTGYRNFYNQPSYYRGYGHY